VDSLIRVGLYNPEYDWLKEKYYGFFKKEPLN
jgi:hypothetical protein